MKGDNLFLLAILIHDGSNESSEKGSETTAISSGTGSGTHPHKILDKPSVKAYRGNIHSVRKQPKNIQNIDLSVIFARKLQKSHLKMR